MTSAVSLGRPRGRGRDTNLSHIKKKLKNYIFTELNRVNMFQICSDRSIIIIYVVYCDFIAKKRVSFTNI